MGDTGDISDFSVNFTVVNSIESTTTDKSRDSKSRCNIRENRQFKRPVDAFLQREHEHAIESDREHTILKVGEKRNGRYISSATDGTADNNDASVANIILEKRESKQFKRAKIGNENLDCIGYWSRNL